MACVLKYLIMQSFAINFQQEEKLWRHMVVRLIHGNTFPTKKCDTTGNGFTDFSSGLGGPITVTSV